MRYLEQDDDIAIWVLLSGLWSCAGVLAWILSLFVSSAVPGETLTFLCLVTYAVGVVLRLPVLTHWLDHSQTSEHTRASNTLAGGPMSTPNAALVWLRRPTDGWIFLAVVVGAVNWLGALLLHCPSWIDAVPLLLIAFAVEGWILWQLSKTELLASWTHHLFDLLPEAGKTGSPLRIVRSLLSSFSPQVANDQSSEQSSEQASGFQTGTTGSESNTPINSEAPLLQETASAKDNDPAQFPGTELRNMESEDAVEEDVVVTRTCQDALDPAGNRFLSGDVLVSMEDGQQKAECVIGFCPPFDRIPDAEVEVLDESIQARVVNRTPTGMRIALRRSGPATSSEEFRFEWFASETADATSDSPQKPALP